jgi:molybdopterin converting factor small subunit
LPAGGGVTVEPGREEGVESLIGSDNSGNAQCYHRAIGAHPMQVEFLGIPRERAGISEIEVDAETLGELLAQLAIRIPALRELVAADGLHPSIAANLNGDAFVSDPRTRLSKDDHLLILSADAGG